MPHTSPPLVVEQGTIPVAPEIGPLSLANIYVKKVKHFQSWVMEQLGGAILIM